MGSAKAEGLRVGGMAGGFVLLNTLDAYLTTKVIQNSGIEMNPIMHSLLERSITNFWLFKISSSAIVAYIFCCLVYKHNPEMATFVMVVCLIVIALACLWNGILLIG